MCENFLKIKVEHIDNIFFRYFVLFLFYFTTSIIYILILSIIDHTHCVVLIVFTKLFLLIYVKWLLLHSIGFS